MKTIKRFFLLIMTISFALLFSIGSVNAESNVGSVTIIGSGGGSGSSTYQRTLIAFGYRASLMKMSTDGSATQVGNSHDFWQSFQNETYGLQGILNTKNPQIGAVARYYYANKKPKQLISGNPSSSVNYPASADSVDTFLGDNSNYARGSFWSTTPGKETSGNYYALNVANKLKANYFKDTEMKPNHLTDADFAVINNILTKCGYVKKKTAKENVMEAVYEDLVLEIEPIEAIGINKQGCQIFNCGDPKVFVGTSTEIAIMTGKDMLESYGYTTYGSPIVYAAANGNDTKNKITVKSGIVLGTSAPASTYANAVIKNGALGCALFRLKDYIPPKYGNLQVLKVDTSDAGEVKKLANVTLTVKNSAGKEVARWTTTEENNPYLIKNLEVGKYTVIEENAPEGYIKSGNIEVTVEENKTVEVKVGNSKPTSKPFKISKQDITTKKELPGAHMQIKNSAGVIVDEWTSTNTPHEVTIKLQPGKYTLVETAAPKGYILNDTPVEFEVDANGEVKETVVMYNEKIPVTAGMNVPLILAGATLMLGLMAFSFKKLGKANA